MASLFELERPSFGRMTGGKALVAGSASAATELTAAESVGSVVVATPTGNRAVTTATFAAMMAELGAAAKVGQTFEITVVNLASATHTLTLGGGDAAVTVVGVAAVAAASSATFVGRINSASAIVFYRA